MTLREEMHEGFRNLGDKVDRLDEAIRGNGKPGLNRRVSDLEKAEKTRVRLLWLIVAASVTAATGAALKLFFC